MRYVVIRPLALLLPIVLGGAAAFLLSLPTPCSANVLPESAILVQVQPVSGSCEPEIMSCFDIVRSTSESGPLEFLFFFEPIAWQQSGVPVCITQFHADIFWPENWELIEFDPCSGSGQLGSSGPPYALDVNWGGTCHELPMEYGEVFLVARLVLNVTGPGRLEFAGDWVELSDLNTWPETFISYSYAAFAEAGMDCEYTHYYCAQHGMCWPHVYDPELILSAPPGGTDEGETIVTAMDCFLNIHPWAEWVQAVLIDTDGDGWRFRLEVTADATGLSPGIYETSIQLTSTWIARCLRIVFTVGDPTSVPAPPEGSVQAESWGSIKVLYR